MSEREACECCGTYCSLSLLFAQTFSFHSSSFYCYCRCCLNVIDIYTCSSIQLVQLIISWMRNVSVYLGMAKVLILLCAEHLWFVDAFCMEILLFMNGCMSKLIVLLGEEEAIYH